MISADGSRYEEPLSLPVNRYALSFLDAIVGQVDGLERTVHLAIKHAVGPWATRVVLGVSAQVFQAMR